MRRWDLPFFPFFLARVAPYLVHSQHAPSAAGSTLARGSRPIVAAPDISNAGVCGNTEAAAQFVTRLAVEAHGAGVETPRDGAGGPELQRISTLLQEIAAWGQSVPAALQCGKEARSERFGAAAAALLACTPPAGRAALPALLSRVGDRIVSHLEGGAAGLPGPAGAVRVSTRLGNSRREAQSEDALRSQWRVTAAPHGDGTPLVPLAPLLRGMLALGLPPAHVAWECAAQASLAAGGGGGGKREGTGASLGRADEMLRPHDGPELAAIAEVYAHLMRAVAGGGTPPSRSLSHLWLVDAHWPHAQKGGSHMHTLLIRRGTGAAREQAAGEEGAVATPPLEPPEDAPHAVAPAEAPAMPPPPERDPPPAVEQAPSAGNAAGAAMAVEAAALPPPAGELDPLEYALLHGGAHPTLLALALAWCDSAHARALSGGLSGSQLDVVRAERTYQRRRLVPALGALVAYPKPLAACDSPALASFLTELLRVLADDAGPKMSSDAAQVYLRLCMRVARALLALGWDGGLRANPAKASVLIGRWGAALTSVTASGLLDRTDSHRWLLVGSFSAPLFAAAGAALVRFGAHVASAEEGGGAGASPSDAAAVLRAVTTLTGLRAVQSSIGSGAQSTAAWAGTGPMEQLLRSCAWAEGAAPPPEDRFWEGDPSPAFGCALDLMGGTLTYPPFLDAADVVAVRNSAARVLQDSLSLAAERTDRPVPRRLGARAALRSAADLWALGLPRFHPFWPALASAALSSPLVKTASARGRSGPRIAVGGSDDFRALRALKELAQAVLTDANGVYTELRGQLSRRAAPGRV